MVLNGGCVSNQKWNTLLMCQLWHLIWLQGWLMRIRYGFLSTLMGTLRYLAFQFCGFLFILLVYGSCHPQIGLRIVLSALLQGARNEIFAMQPAPIQVSYMGFPGTTGASYIHYLVTDEVILHLLVCRMFCFTNSCFLSDTSLSPFYCFLKPYFSFRLFPLL